MIFRFWLKPNGWVVKLKNGLKPVPIDVFMCIYYQCIIAYKWKINLTILFKITFTILIKFNRNGL